MATSEQIKTEQHDRLGAIVNRLDAYADSDVTELAETLVLQRYPLPQYRDPYRGERVRHHAAFVRDRLRLVWAMRRQATLAEADREYQAALS